MNPLFFVVLSYFLGAVPTSFWLGRAIYGVDLRLKGSGNLGASNALRVLGWKAALPVVLVDVAKGFGPAWLFPRLEPAPWSWALAYGAAAILGHVFSVWVRFKGGKGVATSAGVFLGLAPWAVLVGFVLWTITVSVTRIVSLGSVLAALTIPVAVWLLPHDGGWSLLTFTVVLAAFVTWAHRANLGRLLRGEEHRFGEGPGGHVVPPGRGGGSVTTRVAVVGAGGWGTTLAAVLARNGHDVVLWALEPDVVQRINDAHENERFLPGIRIPDTIRATGDLAEALSGADVAVNVVPSQFVGRVMADAAPHVGEGCQLVSASKGIETATLRRMDEVLTDVLGEGRMNGFTVLSGPSFAVEVANEAPTAVVAASIDPDAAARVQRLFQNRYFRVYTNPDVVGVELGGALKNVIALAAGMSSGLGLGHNTLAALITRGLAEMARLGQAMGAQPTTFAGLAGMGDLVLTCTGELSRNRTVGVRLGRGESLASILEEMSAVAEGIKTAQAAHDLAKREGVEMPITSEVRAILVDGRDPREALWSLMQRGPKPEEWS